jgi:hypothetical protein
MSQMFRLDPLESPTEPESCRSAHYFLLPGYTKRRIENHRTKECVRCRRWALFWFSPATFALVLRPGASRVTAAGTRAESVPPLRTRPIPTMARRHPWIASPCGGIWLSTASLGTIRRVPQTRQLVE